MILFRRTFPSLNSDDLFSIGKEILMCAKVRPMQQKLDKILEIISTGKYTVPAQQNQQKRFLGIIGKFSVEDTEERLFGLSMEVTLKCPSSHGHLTLFINSCLIASYEKIRISFQIEDFMATITVNKKKVAADGVEAVTVEETMKFVLTSMGLDYNQDLWPWIYVTLAVFTFKGPQCKIFLPTSTWFIPPNYDGSEITQNY